MRSGRSAGILDVMKIELLAAVIALSPCAANAASVESSLSAPRPSAAAWNGAIASVIAANPSMTLHPELAFLGSGIGLPRGIELRTDSLRPLVEALVEQGVSPRTFRAAEPLVQEKALVSAMAAAKANVEAQTLESIADAQKAQGEHDFKTLALLTAELNHTVSILTPYLSPETVSEAEAARSVALRQLDAWRTARVVGSLASSASALQASERLVKRAVKDSSALPAIASQLKQYTPLLTAEDVSRNVIEPLAAAHLDPLHPRATRAGVPDAIKGIALGHAEATERSALRTLFTAVQAGGDIRLQIDLWNAIGKIGIASEHAAVKEESAALLRAQEQPLVIRRLRDGPPQTVFDAKVLAERVDASKVPWSRLFGQRAKAAQDRADAAILAGVLGFSSMVFSILQYSASTNLFGIYGVIVVLLAASAAWLGIFALSAHKRLKKADAAFDAFNQDQEWAAK